MRHDKSDGALLFFQQMRYEPRGACQQGNALQGQEWVPRVQEHGRNGSGNIEGQWAADQAGQHFFDRACNLYVAASNAGLGCNLEQADGTRVAAFVQRMTVARNRALRLAVLV